MEVADCHEGEVISDGECPPPSFNLLALLGGDGRHPVSNGLYDWYTRFRRKLETGKLVFDFVPEEHALRGCIESNSAFGNAAKVGNVPLPSLAINTHVLDENGPPVNVWLIPKAICASAPFA